MKRTGTIKRNKRDGIDNTPRPGRIYFSKTTERRVLFFMTLAMLGAGILTRLM